MAQLTNNFWGVVVILDHNEVDDAAAVATAGGDMAAFLASKLPGIPAIVLGAVAAYLKAEAVAAKALDQGNGVYLTMPYWSPGLVISTPRGPGIGLPQDWVAKGTGQFKTEDGDLVEYRIDLHAVAADVVEFRLEANNPNMWRKVLVIRDGEGGQWDIAIDPSQGTPSASNGLWAHQVKNSQKFSFWKAKQFAINTWVLDFGGLEAIQPGTRVVFTWLQD